MDPGEEPDFDWKDAQSYAPLLEADRSIFAWEWLRRDPGYRAAASSAFEAMATRKGLPSPQDWGLHAFEDPRLGAPHARPLWTAEAHSPVLCAVAAAPGRAADVFDLRRIRSLATLRLGTARREHLLLCDGLRTLRLDILAGSLADGPVQLRYLISGMASAEKPLLALRRLIDVHKDRRFSRPAQWREIRARRWLLNLRAFDALAAGAGQREIASVLLSAAAGEPRWRSHASSTRSQVQRLVRGARSMAAGGYRELLR